MEFRVVKEIQVPRVTRENQDKQDCPEKWVNLEKKEKMDCQAWLEDKENQ